MHPLGSCSFVICKSHHEYRWLICSNATCRNVIYTKQVTIGPYRHEMLLKLKKNDRNMLRPQAI